jgi:glutathione synthase/RimK-type ligase-like ATP-grasp enzyme
MMQLALANVSVPTTYFSLDVSLVSASIPLPYIAKAVAASRGESNYLVEQDSDIRAYIDQGDYMLIQPYLLNNHDLRVICFNGKPELILRRARAADASTHLNNTSKGGSARWLQLDEVPPELLTLSEKICKITKREMAGIDFIPDVLSDVGYSCLEVNAVPQLTSGTDTDKKIEALARALNKL